MKTAASFKLCPLIVALFLGLGPYDVAAQTEGEDGGSWSLGTSMVSFSSPYRGYDDDTLVLPAVSYEGKSFYFRGTVLGYRLSASEYGELSVVVSPHTIRFRRRDSSDPQLRLLSNREFSGLAGIFYKLKKEWGELSASARTEFTGHGGGYVLDASYGYPMPVERLILVPEVGISHVGAGLNNYYFGVSQRESIRSGLAPYSAGSTTAPRAQLTAIYPLASHWVGSASVARSWLGDSVKDSPMVDGEHTDAFSVSVVYRF